MSQQIWVRAAHIAIHLDLMPYLTINLYKNGQHHHEFCKAIHLVMVFAYR